MIKKILGLSILAEALLISIFCSNIEYYLISETGLSWTMSSILPKALALVFSILGTIVLYGACKRNATKILIVLTPFLFFGISFSSSPIYEGDYSKIGEANIAVSDTNWVLTSINQDQPNYDGLVCILSSSCGHCVTAAEQAKMMKKRNPDLNISIVLYGIDTTEISEFKNHLNEPSFTYYDTKEFNDFVNITLGGFPCLIYIKNNKIIHRWHHEQLGYPAFDWIENNMQD